MKRLVALFTTALMVLLMIPQTVHAASENVTVTVAADKSTAISGDTINFEVSIGAVESLGGLEFTLNIPSGLTISESSVSIPDGLLTTLDSDGDIATPAESNGYKWSYSAQETGYKGTEDLVILSFSCTVDSDAVLGAKDVTINMSTCFDNIAPDFLEHNVTVVPATVTVEKAPVPVTGVTLNTDTLTLKDGEEANLTATVAPSDADNPKVIWSSSNSEVATVGNGKVKAVKEGTATITATTEDGNKTATCTVTVTCNHSLTKTDKKDPTCVNTGNIEYYTCSKCDKKFSDANGVTEVTTTEIAATGNHTEEIRNAITATEEAPGYTGDTYCSVCNQKLATGTEIAQLPCTHNMTHIDAVNASCEVAGNMEYYVCSKCNKMYSDANGTNELTDVSVKATGHTVPDTWVTDTDNHWKVCSVCNKRTDEATHTYNWVVDTAATVEATGVKHEECACGLKRNENTIIEKLPHEHTGITHHSAIVATCTKAGNVEYWTCEYTDCAGKYYSDAECQIEITDVTLAIVPDNHVYEGDKDSNCNECGYVRFYQVIKGANGNYEKNSSEGLTISADGEYSLFDSVKVDGQVVEKANYIVSEGSTVITFKTEYLNTLNSGTHDVEVMYTDGKTAQTQFTINDEDVKTNDGSGGSSSEANNSAEVLSPKTGDRSHVGLAIAVLLCAGIICTVFMKKKTAN